MTLVVSAAPIILRSPTLHREQRPGCPSPIHGTRKCRDARGCVCEDSRIAAVRAKKARDTGRLLPANVPMLGSTRRLQSLGAAGWQADQLAVMLRTNREWVTRVRSGARWSAEHNQVRRDRAVAIARLFDTLPPVPAAERSLNLIQAVAAGGWLPPAAWYGLDLDDPNASPRSAPRTGRRCVDCDTPLFHGPTRETPLGMAPSHHGRGACNRCYGKRKRTGTLNQIPRIHYRRNDVLTAWAAHQQAGLTTVEAAPLMGITEYALRQALYREARAARSA